MQVPEGVRLWRLNPSPDERADTCQRDQELVHELRRCAAAWRLPRYRSHLGHRRSSILLLKEPSAERRNGLRSRCSYSRETAGQRTEKIEENAVLVTEIRRESVKKQIAMTLEMALDVESPSENRENIRSCERNKLAGRQGFGTIRGGREHGAMLPEGRADQPHERAFDVNECGWEAGIRTPIPWSRATCPTVGRPPSASQCAPEGGNFRL